MHNPNTGAETVELLGTRLHNVTLAEFFEWVDGIIAAGTPSYVVTPNVDHVVRLETDADFQRAYAHAGLVVCDSKPMIWAARMLGIQIKQKLSGSDLIYWLTEHAAQKGYRIFLLGAADGVAAEAARILQARFPGLVVAGTHSPPMGFDAQPAENERALALLREHRPDICYIALGSPKQEAWMYANVQSSGVPLTLGIGAALDFVTGRFKRAPIWIQRIGMEWMWRLCSDPRRLFKRYVIDDSRFFVLVFREWTRVRRMRRASVK